MRDAFFSLTPRATRASLTRNAAEGDDGSSIGTGQATRPSVFASILCSIGCDSHDFPGIHKLLIDVPAETILLDDERVWNFQSPIDGFALSVLGIEVDPAVRVLLNYLRQLSNQRQRLFLIVLCLEGMMRAERNGHA